MTRKIFVGGLNTSTTQMTLKNVFARFGGIQVIKLVTDHHTGRSKGFAFITFEDDVAAKVAMSQMDGCQIDGRSVRVNFAVERDEMADDQIAMLGLSYMNQKPQRSHQTLSEAPRYHLKPTNKDRKPKQIKSHQKFPESKNSAESIYVGGIDWNTTRESLFEAFEGFGDIDDIKIVTDKITGLSKGFCFIRFLDQMSAENAINRMNGTTLDGKVIRVNRAQHKQQS